MTLIKCKLAFYCDYNKWHINCLKDVDLEI